MFLVYFLEEYFNNILPKFLQLSPSLVLVQPRKTHPYLTERLLMGRKESKQTNKQIYIISLRQSLNFKPRSENLKTRFENFESFKPTFERKSAY